MSFLTGFSGALLFALCSLSLITSLDDLGTLFVEKLVIAMGTEKFDLLVP
jgi:hypothetical protein